MFRSWRIRSSVHRSTSVHQARSPPSPVNAFLIIQQIPRVRLKDGVRVICCLLSVACPQTPIGRTNNTRPKLFFTRSSLLSALTHKYLYIYIGQVSDLGGDEACRLLVSLQNTAAAATTMPQRTPSVADAAITPIMSASARQAATTVGMIPLQNPDRL